MSVARDQATHDRRQRAHELREQGLKYREIAEQLGYASPSAARRAALAGAEQVPVQLTPAPTFDAEEKRLDELATALQPNALDGNPRAVDQYLRVVEALTRVRSQRSAAAPGMAAAYEETVREAAAGHKVRAIDAALVESGRSIARQIDVALTDPLANRTRVLYLVPHLLNVLREMQATPSARLQLAGIGAAGVHVPTTAGTPDGDATASKSKPRSKRARLTALAGGAAAASKVASPA